MKIGTVCGGNKKFCDFWNAVFKEEMQTQKGKKTIKPRTRKTTLDIDAGRMI